MRQHKVVKSSQQLTIQNKVLKKPPALDDAGRAVKKDQLTSNDTGYVVQKEQPTMNDTE
jgi:hypothetical protein